MANDGFNPKDHEDYLAVRKDAFATGLVKERATAWFMLLHTAGVHLPFYLVADLGVLLVRPEAYLAAGAHVPTEYVALLRQIIVDERFQTCAGIVRSAASDRQDEVVRTAVQSMTRRAQGVVTDLKTPTPRQVHKTDTLMIKSFQEKEIVGWITPTDLIKVRAASRLERGPDLLDFQLLDSCLRKWRQVSDHPLNTRRSPVRLTFVKDVSQMPGNIIAYTGVRPRLPTDDLIEILASEWVLVRKNRAIGLDRIFNRSPLSSPAMAVIGLDKILNRATLVHSKESPEDLEPKLNVLVTFIIDEDSSLFAKGTASTVSEMEKREKRIAAACRAKALIYRMILDAAEQVPFDVMTVHAAVYVLSFKSSLTPGATCFDLREVSLRGNREDSIVRYDELVPFYFCYSYLRASRGARRAGPWPVLSDDPYIFLTSASVTASTYTSVLTVIHSEPGRWPNAFPNGVLPLRPVEMGRPAVMLIEADPESESNMFKWCGFANLAEAAIGYGTQLRNGTDVDVRNGFLDMLLGPATSEIGLASQGEIALEAGGRP